MAEEPQDPQNDETEEAGPDQPLDQDAINEMLQDAQGSEADNLENLLDDLEESPDDAEGEETSDADQMEAMLDNMEGGEESEENLDDILYQATLADAEGTPEEDNVEEDAPDTIEAAPTEGEDTTDEEASALDDLAAMFDDDEEPEPAGETVEAEESGEIEIEVGDDGAEDGAEEAGSVDEVEDLGALLQGLDGEDVVEDPAPGDTLAEADAEDVDPEALEETADVEVEDIDLETLEETEDATEVDLESVGEDAEVEDINLETLDDEEADVSELIETLETDEETTDQVDEEEGFEDMGDLVDALDEDASSVVGAELSDETAADSVEVADLDENEAEADEGGLETLVEDEADVTELVESIEEEASPEDEPAVEEIEELVDEAPALEGAVLEASAETEGDVAGDDDAAAGDIDIETLDEVAEPDVEDVDLAALDDGDEDLTDLVETLEDDSPTDEDLVQSLEDGASEEDGEEVIDLGQVAQDTDDENLFDALADDEDEVEADAVEEQGEEVVAELENADIDELVDDTDEADAVEELTEGEDLVAELEDASIDELIDDLEEAEAPEVDAVEELTEGEDAVAELEDAGMDELVEEGELTDLLDKLGEETEDLVEEPTAELDADSEMDLTELIDDLEPGDEPEEEIEDLEDLADLVGDLGEEEDILSLEETLEEEVDLESLVADDGADGDVDLLADLEDSGDEVLALDDEEEIEDLDSLLGGLDEEAQEITQSDAGDASLDLDIELEDDLDALLAEEDADLTVGVEEEVAHILATGAPPPDAEDSILDDFVSVQADLETDGGDEGGTILVVDSDDENINLFRDALSDGDFGFVTAPSGEEALTAVQMHDVDLILVNLDQGDGEEIVSQLAGPDMPDIPVIVTSGENERIETALQQGAVDHFARPIGVLDLELQVPLTVTNLIRLRRAERMLAGMPAAGTVSDEPEMPSAAEDDLDALLADDPILDDDDFGEDEDDQLEDDLSSSLDLDDLLEDDLSDDLDDSPEAILAGGGSADSDTDRLTPISDQEKMARQMDLHVPTESSNVSKFIGIVALILILASISGLATIVYMDMQSAEMSQPEPMRPIALPVIKPPTIQQAGYQRSRDQVRRPTDYEQQANNVKLRIRNTVRELNDQNAAWWSPWRGMQNVGGSVNVLVQGRSRQDIVDAFGASRSDVDAALNNRRTVNYLEGVGYDVRGKTASDLSPRETFELLSTREIDSTDEIVDVLSRLTDRLASDRAEQSERKSRNKKSGTATLSPAPAPTAPELRDKSKAAFEMLDIPVNTQSKGDDLNRGSPLSWPSG